MAYKLHIDFLKEDLVTVKAAQEQIIIVQYVKQDRGPDIKTAFMAAYMKNLVILKDGFKIYAALDISSECPEVNSITENPATEKMKYIYNGGIFTEQLLDTPLPSPYCYCVSNQLEERNAMLFGLAQELEINAEKIPEQPVMGQVVPCHQILYLAKPDTLDIYLQSFNRQNRKSKKVFSTILTLDIENNGESYVKYDSKIGGFVLQK